jgi:hypothetical protein
MFFIYSNLLPLHWEEECQLSLLQRPLFKNTDDSLSYFAISIALVTSTIALGLAVILAKKACKRRENKW